MNKINFVRLFNSRENISGLYIMRVLYINLCSRFNKSLLMREALTFQFERLFLLSNMAIKLIQAENIDADQDLISFYLSQQGSTVRIQNDSTEPIESIFIELRIEDWIQVAQFISEEIAKAKPND